MIHDSEYKKIQHNVKSVYVTDKPTKAGVITPEIKQNTHKFNARTASTATRVYNVTLLQTSDKTTTSRN